LRVNVSSLKYIERLVVRVVIEIPEEDEPLIFVVSVKLLHECSRRTFTGSGLSAHDHHGAIS
jgi:hypothetical protein